MSDAALRELERRVAAGNGTPDDEDRLDLERLRLGRIPDPPWHRDREELCAFLGHYVRLHEEWAQRAEHGRRILSRVPNAMRYPTASASVHEEGEFLVVQVELDRIPGFPEVRRPIAIGRWTGTIYRAGDSQRYRNEVAPGIGAEVLGFLDPSVSAFRVGSSAGAVRRVEGRAWGGINELEGRSYEPNPRDDVARAAQRRLKDLGLLNVTGQDDRRQVLGHRWVVRAVEPDAAWWIERRAKLRRST